MGQQYLNNITTYRFRGERTIGLRANVRFQIVQVVETLRFQLQRDERIPKQMGLDAIVKAILTNKTRFTRTRKRPANGISVSGLVFEYPRNISLYNIYNLYDREFMHSIGTTRNAGEPRASERKAPNQSSVIVRVWRSWRVACGLRAQQCVYVMLCRCVCARAYARLCVRTEKRGPVESSDAF